jgi:phage terminase large subunit-like protein
LFHVHGRYYLPEDVVIEKATGNFSHYDAWAKQGLLTLTDGDLIDYEAIEDDLRDFASRFQVEEVPYDPFQATQLATRMTAEGFTMVEIAPTAKNFSEPMKHLEALVKVRRLAHGKDPILTWMMSNVMLRPDRANRDLYYPVKEKPENKIDGAVGLIMAISRAMTGGDKGSVYETRGFTVV